MIDNELTKSAIMHSDDEYIDELNELKELSLFEIFKIPLILFILTIISLLFVNIIGKSYIQNDTNINEFNKINLYNSLLLNMSEKQIDKVRIEDMQLAIQLLLKYLDSNFNKTDTKIKELEVKMNNQIIHNNNLTQGLMNQLDNMEREISYKVDYLEKKILEQNLIYNQN